MLQSQIKRLLTWTMFKSPRMHVGISCSCDGCACWSALSGSLLSPVEDGVSRWAHLPVRPGDDVHPRSGGTGRFSCPSDRPGGAEVCTRKVAFCVLVSGIPLFPGVFIVQSHRSKHTIKHSNFFQTPEQVTDKLRRCVSKVKCTGLDVDANWVVVIGSSEDTTPVK